MSGKSGTGFGSCAEKSGQETRARKCVGTRTDIGGRSSAWTALAAGAGARRLRLNQRHCSSRRRSICSAHRRRQRQTMPMRRADSGVNADTDCPSVQVRTGAATLMIGSKPGEGEPSALDLRYQGSYRADRARMPRQRRRHDHEGRHRRPHRYRPGRRSRRGRRAAAHRGGAGRAGPEDHRVQALRKFR